MKFANRIGSSFTSSARRMAMRRSLTAVSVFAAVGLFIAACSDQLPTDVRKSIGSPRLNLSPGDGPRIGTDKQDYSLGETVQIVGWEWTPGETVRLQVVHTDSIGDNERPEHQAWDVVADENGEVSATWHISLDGDEGGASLKLTADGQTSGAHAEVAFTDLIGTVALFTDNTYTTSQTAFQWGASVYARVSGAQNGTCYQFTWRDSLNATIGSQTTATGAATVANAPAFTVPSTSGRYSLIVAQNTSGSCVSSFSSATPNGINFDVARAVVIGAGSTDAVTPDAIGGDHCVFTGAAPPAPACAAGTNATMWIKSRNLGNARAFIRFDLSAATPAVPAGVQVTDAKIRLTVAGTPAAARTYNLYRVTATWNEGSVAWAGPSVAASRTDSAIVTTALVPGAGGGDPQTWVKWDVDADVQSFLSGANTNYGWSISDKTENHVGTGQETRFWATESTDSGRASPNKGCSGATICKRVSPVLLIDYVDPPKLVFTSDPFTGRVGECLGPIQVQRQSFAGTPISPASNLTVGLASDQPGGFYASAGCPTNGLASVQIASGQHTAEFWYKPTGRGNNLDGPAAPSPLQYGIHELTASATDYVSGTQEQIVRKALTTLIYTGDRIVLLGNTYNYSAVLTSAWEPCTENKRIIFRVLPDPIDTDPFLELTPDTTDANGAAGKSAATATWEEGIYDGRTSFSGDADCEASKDDYAINLIAPGGAATGGGFLAGSKIGGGRANFGFTIRQIDGSNPIAYKGQFLMIKQYNNVPQFRCKGTISLYGSVVPATTPATYAASGTCDFQVWDPALDGGLGDWYVPAGPGYTGQTFTFYFQDNGTGSKGKLAPPPDKFGFTIGAVGGLNPSFEIETLNGGNIDVKTGGGSTTTTDGGGTGGTGGKGKNR